jgi:sugar lactone lactonase YvrE
MNTFILIRLAAVLLLVSGILTAKTLEAAAGDLYGVDNWKATIYQFTPSGTRSTFATGLQNPSIIAFDKAGDVYFGEEDAHGSNRITKITSAGSKSTFVTGIDPLGMRFDASGNLFVADNLTSSIVKVSPFGAKSTFATVPNIADLIFDAAGNLYASDNGPAGISHDSEGAIYKFAPNGTKTTFASGLYRPSHLAIDFHGNLFVAADVGTCFGCTGPNKLILKFKPDGSKTTFGSGYLDVEALSCDTAGTLFADVSSASSTSLVKILPSGYTTTFAASTQTFGLAFEPPHGVPVNLATRVHVLTGDNVVIAGFIVTGTGGKQVIIRGLGPSLTAAGVQGALQDPILELHYPGGVTVSTNDNWKDSQAASAIQASGLAPKDDREAAFSYNLPPGTYTIVMKGKNNGTGIGLIEIYDVDGSPACQLANISTRGHVGTGEDVLIGGFILGGNGARVLVRALGPSLTKAGIAGALSDPQLSLRDGNGVEIASNEFWGITYTIDDTNPDQISATGIPPSDLHEAAIVATLPAGNYTAIVRGSDGVTGTGLVEVYNLQ